MASCLHTYCLLKAKILKLEMIQVFKMFYYAYTSTRPNKYLTCLYHVQQQTTEILKHLCYAVLHWEISIADKLL